MGISTTMKRSFRKIEAAVAEEERLAERPRRTLLLHVETDLHGNVRGYRLTVFGGGFEFPFLYAFDRVLVEILVQAARDLRVAHRALGCDDDREQNRALDLFAGRADGVFRIR